MKRYRLIMVLSAVILGTAIVLNTARNTNTWICSAAEIEARTGLTFDWFTSSGHSPADDQPKEATKGYQFTLPVKIGLTFSDFSIDILAGFANTQFTLSGGGTRSLATSLDTKLNFAYPVSGQLPLPFDLLLGLDLNLPTGRTSLKEEDLVLLEGQDLVSVTSFGEGLNLNPTVSLAREWENWAYGFGLGYVFRGKYDYCSTLKEYDPGDILNFTAQLRYDFLSRYQARFFTDYAYFSKDTVKGKDSFQEGDFFLLGLGITYNQSAWDVSANLQSILRGKSKLAEGAAYTPALSTEDKNSHGSEWIAGLSYRYALNTRTSLKPQVEFLWADENDYPSQDPLYQGKKQKFSLGVGASRQISSRFDADVLVKGFVLNQNDRDYEGISLTALLTALF
ncbi:MAG: hypothetical protein AB1847_03085 [bacterium]